VDIDSYSYSAGGVRQLRHLVNGNVKQRRAAARSGEWAQHFFQCFLSVQLLRTVCCSRLHYLHWSDAGDSNLDDSYG